eukprot:GHVH01010873.1.p1 GENE.GHVH01010873.1~~GHVH01010873.1.p1  ORF type:complete len:376 (-),score=60.22 GHVH01010873.1:1120-2247(-)
MVESKRAHSGKDSCDRHKEADIKSQVIIRHGRPVQVKKMKKIIEIPRQQFVTRKVPKYVKNEEIQIVRVPNHIEKIVQVPNKITKTIEIPVIKRVEKVIEKPVYDIIKAPTYITKEKIIEVPVEKITVNVQHKIVKVPKIVEQHQIDIKEVIVEKEVETIEYRDVSKVVKVPKYVEKIIEKIVEIPVIQVRKVTVPRITKQKRIKRVEIPKDIIQTESVLVFDKPETIEREVIKEVPVDVERIRVEKRKVTKVRKVEKVITVPKTIEIVVPRVISRDLIVDIPFYAPSRQIIHQARLRSDRSSTSNPEWTKDTNRNYMMSESTDSSPKDDSEDSRSQEDRLAECSKLQLEHIHIYDQNINYVSPRSSRSSSQTDR